MALTRPSGRTNERRAPFTVRSPESGPALRPERERAPRRPSPEERRARWEAELDREQPLHRGFQEVVRSATLLACVGIALICVALVLIAAL